MILPCVTDQADCEKGYSKVSKPYRRYSENSLTDFVNYCPNTFHDRMSIAPDSLTQTCNTAMSIDDLCAKCQQVDFESFFQFVPSNQSMTASVFEWDLAAVISNNECNFCRFLQNILGMSAAHRDLSSGTVVIEQLRFAQDNRTRIGSNATCMWVSSYPGKMPPPGGYAPRYNNYRHAIYKLAKSTGENENDDLFKCRRINSESIDLNLVSRWISLCENNHEECREAELPGLEKDFRFRVLDVQRGCVIDAPSDCRYFALSYVWGGVIQIRLTSQTYEFLASDGALFDDQLKLATSIEDAILLCQKLNERYLWVDALCILQDELKDIGEQISHMDTIYRRAAVTVVSAGGSDANAPLPGLFPGSRMAAQYTCRVKGLDLISTEREITKLARNSKWNTRGWTVQENVLSRRILVFTENQVFFQCSQGTWREDLVLETPKLAPCLLPGRTEPIDLDESDWLTARIAGVGFGKTTADIKFISLYKDLAKTYATRELTNEDDALAAFTGIIRALEPSLGKFLWALPQTSFGASLLWDTNVPYPIRQRSQFPSWSWVVWSHDTRDYNKGEGLRFPASWYGEVDSAITFYYLNEGELVKYTSGTISPSHLRPDLLAHLIPSDLMNETLPSSVRLLHKRASQLLCFSTSSVHLLVDMDSFSYYDPYLRETRDAHYAVRDSSGSQIGDVLLFREWRQNQPAELEFILIGHHKKYRWLYPMLIEWIDGIARRVQVLRTLTPVKEHIWMAAKPKRKLIILG